MEYEGTGAGKVEEEDDATGGANCEYVNMLKIYLKKGESNAHIRLHCITLPS